MAKNKFYITTAIDYVNARPHVGHAFEKVLADALARWKRLQGDNVFFLTGVDENAQKNVEAAQKAGIPTKEFIDRNANHFIELCNKLKISYDDFVRTTAKEHEVVVHKIVKKMQDKGDIYKGTYKGLYCVGCEAYYSEKELVNGKCPDHNREPELREEEAYFFKLSKYKKELLKLIPEYVVPDYRANEVLARIKDDGLNDICISRKGAKWGIDFPSDKEYKIWVWIDALINYISGLKDKEKEYWPANVHVIGKGINWFHSVIWPAMLLSAGYKLPEKLMVHGYLVTDGKKMSKSLGNVIDPLELLNKYRADTVRYSLLKCNVFQDSDYTEEILIERHNNELANKLGNLVSRVSTLAEAYGLEKTSPKSLKSDKLVKTVTLQLDSLEFDKALNEIFAFIDKTNEYIQTQKPWETKNKKVLYELANAIKDATILLSPFIPSTAEKISKTFNFKLSLKDLETPLKVSKISKSEILFKKIEIKEDKTNNPKKSLFNNYKSYLMGASKITDSDLKELGIEIAGKEGKSRLLIIPNEKIEQYTKLIETKLDNGFWNEAIGDRIIFVFKHKDGKIRKIILDDKNMEEVARLCAEFNNHPYEKTSDLLSYLLDNEFYADYVSKIKNQKANKPAKVEGVISMDQIKYDDFAKIDLRVGTIKKAEDIEGADKLLKLQVEIGEEKRTILAGIKKYYSKDELVGKQVIVIVNLEPRKMKGLESQGMLLAASNHDEDTCVLISPEKKVKSGLKIS